MLHRIIVFFLLSFLFTGTLSAQRSVWVFFTDKGPDLDVWYDHPDAFLSPQAISVRKNRGISIDFADLPVHSPYLHKLRESGFEVLSVSRWLNAAAVRCPAGMEPTLRSLPMVVRILPVTRYTTRPLEAPVNPVSELPACKTNSTFNYGYAATQNHVLNIECLHLAGFTGRNVLVMVCDAGFLSVDTMTAYDSIFIENRMINTWDFVTNDSMVYEDYFHGALVLSNLCGNQPGYVIGTAPHVSLLLARTENISSESHVEEYNWLEAMEWADSQGVQIIHSSIGYAIMDTLSTSYTYADLNGDSAIITRAADLAASRGILVVNSAGNEGFSTWHYITVPCDGDSVLCVGAVDSFGVHAGFSSYGPSSDGRIKPDVVAMGKDVYMMTPFGIFPTQSNGTSFAAPQVAGLAACLVQAHPFRSNMEVIDAIRMSADHYTNPDNSYGYGIPDACVADSILTAMDMASVSVPASHLTMYPNPAGEWVNIELGAGGNYRIELLDLSGRAVCNPIQTGAGATEWRYDLRSLPVGVYLVRVTDSKLRTRVGKLIINKN